MTGKVHRKQTCLDDLRDRILTLDIAPGAQLFETELSEAYGISRTPLREVLQRLSGEGYVRMSENRGSHAASMDLGVIRSFFQTAPMIYAGVTRQAAENRTAHQIAELKGIQLCFEDAIRTKRASDMATQNHRFHAKIGDMSSNLYLLPALRRLQIDHTRLSQMFFRPVDTAEVAAIETACAEHVEMIAAIEAQDAQAAAEVALRHWDLSRDRMARFVQPDPLEDEVLHDAI